MRQKLLLWLLGLADTRQYTLKQSHGAPPFAVAWDNTTLEEEASCGYLSAKTVRSIVLAPLINILGLQAEAKGHEPCQTDGKTVTLAG